jgi:hypothetical protein
MLTPYLPLGLSVTALLMSLGAVYYVRKAAQDREKAARLLREASARQQGRRLP